jgi:ribonuclease HII
MMKRILQEEKKLWRKRYKYVIGLDEAGRGPLAGPVVAAAVTIKPGIRTSFLKEFEGIKDSKKLSPRKRQEIYQLLINHDDINYAVGRVSGKKIDQINILEASKLAMTKAIKKLKLKPDFLIIDGNFKLDLNVVQKSIIKADEKVFSCMAAGIISKVFRDRIMKNYAKKFPQYGFDKNKGYPVEKHFKAIKKHSFCSIHRKTFKLVKS